MANHLGTVLLVDDLADIRQILRGAFEPTGLSVCGEAENGAEAITQAAKYKPDLIILDVSMPVMNGLQAAPELRRILPDTPIILFTQYADNILKRDAMAAGVSSVVPKSDLEALLSEAQSQLEILKTRKIASAY
jgi:CheY-like chemotaxis protein